MKVKLSVATLSLMLLGHAHAEPDVVTSGNYVGGSSAQTAAVTQQIVVLKQSLQNIQKMDFPGKLQALEAQLQAQQGQLQELQHQLKQMKKQQALQYQDLDKRIGSDATPATPVMPTPIVKSPIPKLTASPASTEQDKRVYQAAYQLVANHQYDDAIEAFKGYLAVYQNNGTYSANAYYWLGELYAVKKQNDQALDSLNTVITEFPKSNKVPDATLKMGVIEKSKGNAEVAQKWFKEVIEKYPGTTSAKLAQQQLANA